MKLGIVGLPGSGKATVFEALTGTRLDLGQRQEARLGTVTVPDARIDTLSAMYRPRKTIYAQVEYLLPGKIVVGGGGGRAQNLWTPVRDADALIHVVRNFSLFGAEPPAPCRDYAELNQELILSDLVVVEKRLERLAVERKRHREVDPEEGPLLEACRLELEAERPLRGRPELAAARALRGFAFLSAKPMLVLFNNVDEDDARPPVAAGGDAREMHLVIRGKLEAELSRMSAEEAAEFLNEFDIPAAATDRVIKASYDILGRISFFTVGDDEVRAWTIAAGTPALEAAGTVHSDIQQGFIRAEVMAYDDLMAAGSAAEARKQGVMRLEGKQYAVLDGDIINFRFNV